MAAIIDCPSCGRKLRIPEALPDQKVRCPSCATIFDAAPVPSPALPELDQPAAAAPEPSEPPRAPDSGQGYVEVHAEPTEPAVPPRRESLPVNPEGERICCPSCGEETPRRFARCQACGKAVTEESPQPWEEGRERQQRLDCEPHRANTVLMLGIIGFLPLLGVVFGIMAWVMGQRDLRKMARKEMDVRGRSTTQAGWICGMISTAVQAVILLTCGGCFGLMVWSSMTAAAGNRSRPPTPPPTPQTAPVQPMRPAPPPNPQ